MISYLSDPNIMSAQLVEEGWSVSSLLDEIINSPTRYNALIDTGALITGLTNYQVAEYLITHGLDVDGVVFLVCSIHSARF